MKNFQDMFDFNDEDVFLCDGNNTEDGSKANVSCIFGHESLFVTFCSDKLRLVDPGEVTALVHSGVSGFGWDIENTNFDATKGELSFNMVLPLRRWETASQK